MFKIKKYQPGFTIIEFLVAFVMVGIIGTIIIVSIQSIKARSRDVARVANVKKIHTALSLYFENNKIYPTTLLPGTTLESNNEIYLKPVPNNSAPYNDGGCPNLNFSYYQLENGANYYLNFCLGSAVNNLAAGRGFANANQIISCSECLATDDCQNIECIPNLIGWWRLNGNALDNSGFNNHGTVYTATTTADRNGNPNSAYSFNGSPARINMGNVCNLTGAFTIVFWAAPQNINQVGIMVAKRLNYSPWTQYNIGIGTINGGSTTASKRLYAYTGTYTGGTGNLTGHHTVNDNIFDGNWHHIAIIRQSNGTIIFYVDNQVVPIVRTSGTTNYSGSLKNDASLFFGYNNGSTYFRGFLDDIRIYNRDLTASEINKLYNNIVAN